MNFIKLTKPDDWHVHFREVDFLKVLVPPSSKQFNRVVVMPNLIKPIVKEIDAIQYKKEILKCSKNKNFDPLMTFYLTETISPEEIEKAYLNSSIFAAKLYPSGATTNSSKGVKDIKKIFPVLDIMSKIGMPLLIHGEVNDPKIDVFDREKVFLQTILKEIILNFPSLKITLEHITTEFGVNFILKQRKNVKASITPHHLILNRSDMLEHKIKPHLYCLPILKRENDRLSLIEVATQGNDNFFLGTDSAPHDIKNKETACGCAGIFNTINCIPTLVQLFENNKMLNNLEKFISINGAKHYNLKINDEKIVLFKKDKPITFKDILNVNDNKIKIFKPPFKVFWHFNKN